MVLFATFLVSAAFAVSAMVGTWQANAAAILSLRQQMRDCAEMRDFRFALKTTEVRSMGARIYRPAAFRASRRPLREEPVRAAA